MRIMDVCVVVLYLYLRFFFSSRGRHTVCALVTGVQTCALPILIRFANTLRKMGVQRGDRVTIYMPMIPEGAVAMLACARIGAVHSVIFGGFSPDAIAGRIEDCASDWVICADEGLRGGRTIPLKARSEEHTSELQSIMRISYAVFC